MSVFDIAAILITIAAVSGYVNHRLLHLPPTSGTLLVVLVSSLTVVALQQLIPGLRLQADVERFLAQIDFNETLMHGLLCFLLFAVRCMSIWETSSLSVGPLPPCLRSACCCRWRWSAG